MDKKDDLDFGFEIDDDLYDDIEEETSRYRMKKRDRRKRFMRIAVLAVFLAAAISLVYGFNGKEDTADSPSSPEEGSVDAPVVENNNGQAPDNETPNDMADDSVSEQDTHTEDGQPVSGEEQKVIKHVVEKGDSLYKISVKYYESPEFQNFLAAFNHLTDEQSLTIGQELEVPYPPSADFLASEGASVGESNGAVKHEVQQGDSLYRISLQYFDSPEYQEAIAKYNGIEDPSKIKVGDILEIPPKFEE